MDMAPPTAKVPTRTRETTGDRSCGCSPEGLCRRDLNGPRFAFCCIAPGTTGGGAPKGFASRLP
jgi:hypothetical protein